jgi:hypothetical protein
MYNLNYTPATEITSGGTLQETFNISDLERFKWLF